MPLNESERKDIEELLPWHAAGTLEPARRAAGRSRAGDDPELARRYELVREELAQTIQLNETLDAPSTRAMEKLFAKIDAEPARKAASLDLGVRIGEFFARLSRALWRGRRRSPRSPFCCKQVSSPASCLRSKGGGGYETASAPAAVKGEGSYALIRFQPQADAADITKFLETNKLTLTGGPMAGGLYRVKVAPQPLAKNALADLIEKLQQDKVVAFIAATE